LGSNQANLILSITGGQRSGEHLLIPPGEVRTVGRTIASDIAVGDNFMSGVHFEIENYGEFAELRDRNSTNKTWVNHSTQMKCRVAPGDVIRAGKTQFSVQWEAQPQLDVSSSSPGSVDETYDSDDSGHNHSGHNDSGHNDSGHNHSSPIGPSYAVFPGEAMDQPTGPAVVKVAKAGNYVPTPRSSSPFESLDASYLSKLENRIDEPSFTPKSQEISHREFASPFDESSVFKSSIVSPAFVQPISKPTVIRVLNSRLSVKDTDIWSIIQSLSKHGDLRVVSHFRKIGQLTPSNLSHLPVFPFLANANEHLPVIVKAIDWLRVQDRQVTERLAQEDGLVLVLTKGTSAVDTHLQELSNCGVAGFSEGNGFLGWCWPSQLQAILSSFSEPAKLQFFGETIDGFLFSNKSNWIAYAKPDLVPALEKFGFA